MSGDLRDPARSLPRGTFWAVGLSTVVNIVVALMLASSLPLVELESDYGSMRRVAKVRWLIEVGVIAATLSSALASFMGAPRVLQSLAKDAVFPVLNPFAVGAGPSENPRRGARYLCTRGLRAQRVRCFRDARADARAGAAPRQHHPHERR
jgi:amino acid transporter